MFNIIDWLKKSCKKAKTPSLQEVEQMLNSASYLSDELSTEFKQELLNKLLAARRSNKKVSMETTSFFKGFIGAFRWKVWIPAVSLGVIILLLLPLATPLFDGDDFFLVNQAYAADTFMVTAEKEDVSGIEADTTFKVTTKVPVKEEELKKNLRFEPEASFTLTELSETEFIVTLEDALESGRVHNVIIDSAFQNENGVVVPHEFRFAFQVKDTFKILKSLPGDRTNNVPTNTGIEITFSHSSVDVSDFQKHFSISPNVAGRFEKHGRALVFVPQNPLEAGALYKVSVSKGMQLAETSQTIDKDYLFEFFTRGAYLSDVPSYLRFNYSEDGWPSFEPNTAPHFDVSTKGIHDDTKVTVYKINSLDDLRKRSSKLFDMPRWVYVSYSNYSVDTKGLPVSINSTVGDTIGGDEFGRSYLDLPKITETGLYVVEVKPEGGQGSYQIFQITNLKAYFTASQTKSFVWVHNAGTKKPVSGAAVLFTGRSDKFRTDDKGLAIFDTIDCPTGDKDNGEFMSIKFGEEELSLFLNRDCRNAGFPGDGYSYDYGASYDYWHTLSVDRGIYLPTDSIMFWGVAKSRKNNGSEELIAEINSYETGKLAKITVKTSDIGTFTGKFDIRNVRPGGYELFIKNKNGNIIDTRYLTIATFQKPLYDIETKISKSAVLIGEKVNVTVKVAFFDGTPAHDMEFQYYNDIQSGLVRTDKNGEANVVIDTANIREVDMTSNSVYYDNPSYQSIRFTPTATEYSDISSYESFRVYRADVGVNFDYDTPSSGKNATGTVKKIDLSGSESYDVYKEAVPNYPVTGSIMKITRDKIQTGESYDPITKTVTPRYTYKRREEVVNNFSVLTDGEGKFKVDYPFNDKEEYRMIARVKDSKGRQAGFSRTFYGYNETQNADEYINVSLRDMNAPDYRTGAPMKEYEVGDKINLQVQVNYVPREEKDEYVFYTMQSGLLDIKADNSPSYEFKFEKQHAPNVIAGIVWFDGTYYNSSGMSYDDLYLWFKKDTKKLDISVTTDRATYGPGDKAKLTVEAKDADGKPVSAEVNVKLIDEAIYALRETYDSTLETIYSSLPSGILSTLTTARQPRSMGGGKGGGGDEVDEGVRSAFKNTAYFGVVNTDNNGKATIDVDLPDDITTFRITAQGFTEDIEAGVSRTPLVISQPFFLDLTMNDVYLVADKPAIRLRAFGTELENGADVKFSVSIPSLGVKNTEISAKAGGESWYTLPALKAGQHEITIRAKSGNLSDAVMKKINVADSLVTESIAETKVLAEDTSLKNVDSPRAKLVFSLNPYGGYYSALESLKWGYSGRLDAELAAIVSKELLAAHFGEEQPETSKNLAIYQGNTGGLMLLPYDSADLDITYRAVLVGANYFDTVSLERYFDDIIDSKDSNREEVAKALTGKAALGLPVLNELKVFFKTNNAEMTPDEKLAVAFGLASLGDYGLANEILNEVLKDKTERDGDTMLVNFTRDEQENLELTAQTLAIAAIANHPYAEYLWNGLQNFKTSRTLTSLEQAIALKAFLRRLPPVQEGSVKFNLPGRSDTIKIKKAETDQLMVSDTELKQISFSDIKGPMAVTIYRDVPLGSTGQDYSNTLAVAREYKADGKKTNVLEEGDIVTVMLTPRISSSGDKSGFVVSDTLPTGLLPLANVNYKYFMRSGKGGVGGSQVISHPYLVEGQRVSFRYWPQYSSGPITYLARVVSKGTFNAEPAVIQSLDNPGRINISDSAQIEIK